MFPMVPRRLSSTAVCARCSPAGWWTRRTPGCAQHCGIAPGLAAGTRHHPGTDDIRPDNPPRQSRTAGVSRKGIRRVALRHEASLPADLESQATSCRPFPGAPPGGRGQFRLYPVRQLDAEVLSDALCEITGTTEKYSSSIPEPFTFIPEKERSIALPDGSITSSFLEMFGRPPRDTVLESERNNLPTANQRLHLLNSSHISARSSKARNSSTCSDPRQSARRGHGIFLAILSRFPTENELPGCGRAFSGRWCGQPGGGAGRRVGLDHSSGICVPALKRTVHENKPSICCFGGASVPASGSSAASPPSIDHHLKT